jgi:CheY-like chemotaxis protein
MDDISPRVTPIHVLLADDDTDDRYIFNRVLSALPVPTRLVTVDNGEKLINYLSENSETLPDVLFLDLNMPRKNGSDCLIEIKLNEKLKHLPVIIYSTSLHINDADFLYMNGAHYYIRKTDMIELAKILHYILNSMIVNKFSRPPRDKFIFIVESV